MELADVATLGRSTHQSVPVLFRFCCCATVASSFCCLSFGSSTLQCSLRNSFSSNAGMVLALPTKESCSDPGAGSDGSPDELRFLDLAIYWQDSRL